LLIKDRELRLSLKLVLSAAAVALLAWVLVKLKPILTVFIIAILAVYCITPLVNFLIRRRFPPVLAAIGASLLLLIALFLFFYLLLPGLIHELGQLATFSTTDLLSLSTKLTELINDLDQRYNLQLMDTLLDYMDQFTGQIPARVEQLLLSASSFFMAVLSRAWVLLALVFLVFYLVQDLEKAKKNITLLFPQIYQGRITRILGLIDEKVGGYIRGTLLKCALAGLLTSIGLFVLKMPFALMLGGLAGLLNIIPYIGPILAAVPAVLLSLLPDTPNIFLVVGLYILVEIVDSFVFTPIFLGKAVDLSPLTVVVSVLIGGQLLGTLGIILAIPAAAICKVLLFHYFGPKPPEQSSGDLPAPVKGSSTADSPPQR
jgi:predicted PurR-regulated permease PerM